MADQKVSIVQTETNGMEHFCGLKISQLEQRDEGVWQCDITHTDGSTDTKKVGLGVDVTDNEGVTSTSSSSVDVSEGAVISTTTEATTTSGSSKGKNQSNIIVFGWIPHEFLPHTSFRRGGGTLISNVEIPTLVYGFNNCNRYI